MKCVSYTRTTHCKHIDTDAPHTIAEQNQMIAEYAARRGWKISKKYSDRSKSHSAHEAFLKMKADAIKREFECIVFVSMDSCGANATEAERLFRYGLYPAGIQFAVVEDDFYSAEHTDAEVLEYLEHYQRKYRGFINLGVNKAFSQYLHLNTYGYRYDFDTDMIYIDEESAAIVREIYDMYINKGMSTEKIKNVLNARGIEPPWHYFYRTAGMRTEKASTKWGDGAVGNILKNDKFPGMWSKVIKGKSYNTPAIISIDTFEMAQVQLKKNKRGQECKLATRYPFNGMLFDKGSGMKLAMRKYKQCPGEIVVMFNYPKEYDIEYDKPYMYSEDLISAFNEAFNIELAKARAAAEHLANDELICSAKQEKIEALKSEIREVSKILTARIVEDKDSLYREELQKHDDNIELLYKDIDELDKAYSMENPWVALYKDCEIPSELTLSFSRKHIERIDIQEFTKVFFTPKHQHWRDMLPSEWFEELI